ncbi:uncharacterized protein LOC109828831 isoform X2 [Asparagus officinalis]|uniref:uncharacterized protein LOC109828831 isoform X2 n=1 Tax=Asparagus officinalis TaxID=4686 RepID=UPI00098DEAAB|nr:uncharacterized protein LOC109828831 isoform X2 [Asparagus officinalis]
MTNEVKNTSCDLLEEESSLFNMGFASDGLSWVKSICQSLETSCNIYVDTCNKYVNTAGEHIKKIYEEVRDWENESLFDDEGPISDLDSKHVTTSKVPGELSVELLKSSSSENLPASCQKQPIVSLSKDSDRVELSSESKAQVHVQGISCDGINEEPLSNGVGHCSDVTKENCKELPDDQTEENCKESSDGTEKNCKEYSDDSEKNHKESLDNTGENCKEPLDDPTSPHEQDSIRLKLQLDGGPLTVSVLAPPAEDNGTSLHTMGFCENDYVPQVRPHKIDTSGQFEENEFSDSDGRDDLSSGTSTMLNQNSETEKFESIKNEDFFYIAENNEKNMPFKKKLRNIFSSRKGYNSANYQYRSNDSGAQIKQMSSASFASSGDFNLNLSSNQESIDSGWELL